MLQVFQHREVPINQSYNILKIKFHKDFVETTKLFNLELVKKNF
jgi:hypothetical protein